MATFASAKPHSAALAFLALQVVLVMFGLFRPDKHFNWVPYDELSNYRMTVVVAGDTLPDAAVRTRYRRPARHRENRSIHNLIALVRQYETTYGKHDAAIVTIDYTTNGQRPRRWRWPEGDIAARRPVSPPR